MRAFPGGGRWPARRRRPEGPRPDAEVRPMHAATRGRRTGSGTGRGYEDQGRGRSAGHVRSGAEGLRAACSGPRHFQGARVSTLGGHQDVAGHDATPGNGAPLGDDESLISGGGEGPGGEQRRDGGRGRSGRGRRTVAGLLAVVVAGGTTALAVNLLGDDGAVPPARSGGTAPAATATITRGDVVDHESVDGKLTYAGEGTIPVTASGVVTWA